MAYGIKYMDGFQAVTEVPTSVVRSYPVASGVAIAKGDCLVITQAELGMLEVGDDSCGKWSRSLRLRLGTNTAAEASSSGAVEILAIPILGPGDV